MLAYRITLKEFSKRMVAPGFSGRWNGSGRRVVYCAESIALAFMENMVRRQGVGFNDDFKIMILDIPDTLKISKINADHLPKGWRNFTNYSKCQPIGNDWYDKGEYPILEVPSAVLPQCYNYVINSLHDDYKQIKILKITDLVPDERIELLLKKREHK